METVKNFMESSSIGGVPQISASKTKCEKLFWVVVVVVTLAMTGYLTAEAFVEWAKYPIATTTETFPISGVQFPKIVVCPPKVQISFIFMWALSHKYLTFSSTKGRHKTPKKHLGKIPKGGIVKNPSKKASSQCGNFSTPGGGDDITKMSEL